MSLCPDISVSLAAQSVLLSYLEQDRDRIIPYFRQAGEELSALLRSSAPLIALGPSGKVGRPYLWRCENRFLILKVSRPSPLSLRYSEDSPFAFSFSPEEIACLQDNPTRLRYIGTDEFLNETLIGYFLTQTFTRLALPPFIVRQYQGGWTDGGGLNLMEYADLGTLATLQDQPFFSSYLSRSSEQKTVLLSPLLIFNILTQIVSALDLLQYHCHFLSGDLKAGNVFLSRTHLRAVHRGLLLEAPFVCKIADYGKSSCSLPSGLRLYHQQSWADHYFRLFSFRPDVSNGIYALSYSSSYQIPLYARHLGLPYYRSFDYYTLLISWLSNPAVYSVFFSTPYLHGLFWDGLWPEDETEEVRSRLEELIERKEGQSINDALAILNGRRLRCEAIELVLQRLGADPREQTTQ